MKSCATSIGSMIVSRRPRTSSVILMNRPRSFSFKSRKKIFLSLISFSECNGGAGGGLPPSSKSKFLIPVNSGARFSVEGRFDNVSENFRGLAPASQCFSHDSPTADLTRLSVFRATTRAFSAPSASTRSTYPALATISARRSTIGAKWAVSAASSLFLKSP